MVSRDNFELANQRAKELNAMFPKALSARYDHKRGRVVITLDSRVELSFAPQDAQGLESAKPSQLGQIEISASGYGIHFPKLDADLYLPGLLEGLMVSRKWMASRLGQIGGRSRSRAKKSASRANGKLGGRPRKAV